MDEFRTVIPNHFALPRRINRLGELAYNLWWTWNPDAQRLFARIDSVLWEKTNHNAIQFLRLVEPARFKNLTNNRYSLDFYDRIVRAFDEYVKSKNTWFARTYPEQINQPIAYFSTEFGLHETLPIYAGGLGVLSGDYLKGASDLGLPLVSIGFLYTQGYFSQHISEDGWQVARYMRLKFEELPVLPFIQADGLPMTISVELPGRTVHARLWEIRVGRVPLYLLDSDVEGNSPADRELTSRLYISDLDSRISQEIILGIGGVRALRALGYNPDVWHMNEGHSAFMVLERIRELVAGGNTYDQAIKVVKPSTVFTTHTPVPAGSDEFPIWLVDKYFSNLWPQLGLTRDEFINLAHHNLPWGETFSMPILALNFSSKRNGVSEMHGKVARKMWNFLWPDLEEEKVPITHITNGVHTSTWLARRLSSLYYRYLGNGWKARVDDPATWDRIDDIPDLELWTIRRHLKRKMSYYIQERARDQWLQANIHPVQIIASGVLLDPYALTIGFARRFATYKRANLILHDISRLLDIINRPEQPVQIIFAGKAHPADEPGKLLIQEVYRAVKKAEYGGRLIFLEDYDMNLARYLVQGVDVWMNTPRRPNEASGTSGQKAAMNGVLNFSVLDGWWREGFNGSNGWAIGDETEYENNEQQDAADSNSLYDTLENKIIPLYYQDRAADNLPCDWIAVMKDSIKTLSPNFSIHRMVKEYTQRMYLDNEG